jgi:hypothetical protein
MQFPNFLRVDFVRQQIRYKDSVFFDIPNFVFAMNFIPLRKNKP